MGTLMSGSTTVASATVGENAATARAISTLTGGC